MDELASTLLDRINGLAKKSLKSGEAMNDEQHRTALVRITENVRLIKRLEKVAGSELDDEDDTSEETIETKPHRGRRPSSAPSNAAV